MDSLSGKNGNPVIIPIPGASHESRVRENSKVVMLDEQEMAHLGAILKEFSPMGGRYPSKIPLILSTNK